MTYTVVRTAQRSSSNGWHAALQAESCGGEGQYVITAEVKPDLYESPVLWLRPDGIWGQLRLSPFGSSAFCDGSSTRDASQLANETWSFWRIVL